MIRPPATGPTIGPTRRGMATKLMARTRSGLPKVRASVVRPTGIIMAPPRPCRTRQATRLARVVGRAHKDEARGKKGADTAENRRGANLWRRQTVHRGRGGMRGGPVGGGASALVGGLFVTLAALASWAEGRQAAPQLANPASQNCVKQGGLLKIERRPDGGQYGVCIFTDNYQCEEWALLRGECPKNGLRVTGYVTAAGRYCAITGGRYTVVTETASAEQGAGSLPDGKARKAEAYHPGSRGR